eukprot:gb/GEZN01004204.1/.p1 GENE.gb/GEZN01004204.1/~~gb/GEZN01004204.1/.p1  ORF type:complete len:633 (+),score=181.02 gb/GEZN01004204.1/:47-1945(+)
MFGAKVLPKRGKQAKKGDVETDPARILKLKECSDMFLAGGYFRARIPTLSPFDKVVGGLVWSITASNVELDVDIIFEENSTIGQRIKLSEQVCRALATMQCPDLLQPQQIQGLDFDSLFPVIRWLVRKVLEVRSLTGDLVRMQALSQFSQHYAFPSEESWHGDKYIREVRERFKPQRLFTQKQGQDLPTDVRTTATLLEYGEKIYGQDFRDEEAEEARREKQSRRVGAGGKAAAALEEKEKERAQKQQAAEQKALQQQRKKLDALQGSMAAAESEAGVSGASVGNMVKMSAEVIREAAEEYHKNTEEMNEVTAAGQGKASAVQTHKRQVDALERKIEAENEKFKTRTAAHQASLKKKQLTEALLKKKQDYHARVTKATAELVQKEQEQGNREILEKLKELVMLNESLKAQEQAFKENCKKEREKLVAMLKQVNSGDEDDDTRKMKEIERIYQTDLSKLDKLRELLAKKNQEIARINRLIDEIPTRAELLQYERRFVELYEMVSEKLLETRKYYSMYNTLDDSHRYMTQEVKLLNQIVENFPTAMKTKGGRDQFLNTFDQILSGVEKQKDQGEKDYDQERALLDVMKSKHNNLLSKQRAYFKAVKDYEEECFRNEKLEAALTRLAQKAEQSQD